MDRWNFVYEMNEVKDEFICETLEENEKKQDSGRRWRTGLAAAAIFLLFLAGSRALFVQGNLRYRVIELKNPLEPKNDVLYFPLWNRLERWQQYSKVKYKGKWYFAVSEEKELEDGRILYQIEKCKKEELEQKAGRGTAVGKEVKQGIIGNIEILHEAKVSVYEIKGADRKDTIAVLFEGEEAFYCYRRIK